jgi:HEAT repeat protein
LHGKAQEYSIMKKLVLSGLCCAGLVALLPETGRAHGGQYRGPGDVVPPAPGGGRGTGGPSGPTTGGPAAPGAPAPSGPTTPGPSAPTTGGPAGGGGGKGGTTGIGGGEIGDDLTQWSFWWEFNKDPYIRLKDAVHQGFVQTGSDDFYLGATKRRESVDSLKPTEEQIVGEVLPALKKAIDSTTQRDINSSCMVAMAKIGKNHPDFKLIEVFKPRLKTNDQEIRETAALSIGISAIAEEQEIKLLSSLALDDAEGRKASEASEVNDRTRTFAIYGLGLAAYSTTNIDLKRTILDKVKRFVSDERQSGRNIKVAAINAISLLNLSASTDAEKALIDDALDTLETYYKKSLGAGEQLIQAHVPPAIAKLIGRDHPKADKYKELFAADLQEKQEKGAAKRSGNEIPQSCVLALGQLCKPIDDEKKDADAKYSKLLLDTYHDHKDQQTRFFSALALGQIGGKHNRDVLLREFDKGRKVTEKPWCALALGVYSFHRYEAQTKAGATIEIEKTIGDTLFAAMKENKEPSLLSALAIGLGLTRFTEAADHLRAQMVENQPKEQLCGYLCIGLALMNDVASKEAMRDVVARSTRRPALFRQAASALGKLGDKDVADQLRKLLTEGEVNLAKLSAIASALGFIGDRRTITPLRTMLFDDQLTELSRAFAAAALGGIADKEPLPWNSKISVNTNYRASTETLTDGATGILDIL